MASVTKPAPGKTTSIPPSELRLFGGRNPRQGDVDAIAASLRRHSQYAPITANIGTHTGRAYEIIKGNHTTLAFRQLAEDEPDDPRWRKILVHWVDVDDDMATRIMTADNRTGQLGGYDNDVLAELLKGFGSDLDGLGYTEADVADLEALNAQNTSLDDPDVPVTDPPPVTPKPTPQGRYDGAQFVLHHDDSLDVLKTLAADSIDAVVTDPPYGLEFMGKEWDSPWKDTDENLMATRDKSQDLTGKSSSPFLAAAVNKYQAGLPFQQWCTEWATECLRVLRPGGHLLAFGGTRTWHRLAAAVEDAGFEIRDSMAWLYGSGFPKSLDVSKAIDKQEDAVREVVGKYQPPNGSTWNLANDEARSEVGAIGHSSRADSLNITAAATDAAKQWQGWGTALKPAFEPIVVARKPLAEGTVAANVLAHGTGALNIDACRIDAADGPRVQGAQIVVGATPFGGEREGGKVYESGRWPANVILDEHTAAEVDRQSGVSTSRRGEMTSTPGGVYGGGNGLPSHTGVYGHDDTGGASRFFYTAKAATSERPRDDDGTAHPTVKPLELMRWLIRLVTPPKGVVLEPFAGSGTTVEACLLEGAACVAIEREADYIPLIVQRIRRAGGVIADPLKDLSDPFGDVADPDGETDSIPD